MSLPALDCDENKLSVCVKSCEMRVGSEPEPAQMDCWAAGVVPTVVNIRRQSETNDLWQPEEPAAYDDDQLRSVLTFKM